MTVNSQAAAPTFNLNGLSADEINLVLAGLEAKRAEIGGLQLRIQQEANGQLQAFVAQQQAAQTAQTAQATAGTSQSESNAQGTSGIGSEPEAASAGAPAA